MKRPVALIALLVLLLPGAAFSQGLPTATPEEVGLSSQKLARVTEAVKAEIAKGRYPGAVALVARRGKVAYFEALGQRDPAERRAHDEGRDLPPLLDDQALHLGRGHDAGRGRAPPAERSRLPAHPEAQGPPGERPTPRHPDRQGELHAGAGRARDDDPGSAPPHLRARLRPEHEPRRGEGGVRQGGRGLERASPRPSRSSASRGCRSRTSPARPGSTASRPTCSDVWSRR